LSDSTFTTNTWTRTSRRLDASKDLRNSDRSTNETYRNVHNAFDYDPYEHNNLVVELQQVSYSHAVVTITPWY